MDGVTGVEVEDVVIGTVKDWKGKPAPKKLIRTLKKAGIVSFSCCGGVDWNTVEADAQSLLELFSDRR